LQESLLDLIVVILPDEACIEASPDLLRP